MGEQARDAKFVDVKDSRMAEIEDEWVPQVVIRGLVEPFRAVQARKQHLSQCPSVVEIVEQLCREGGR